MKKFLIAAVMAFAAVTTAHATDGKNFGKLEYEFNQVDGNRDNSNQVNVVLGREVAPGLKLDIKGEFSRSNDVGALGDRFEAGATYSYNIFSVRGAVGEKFTTGDQYTYYLIEPGVKVPLSKEFAVFTKYRFRDAFDSGRSEETHRIKVGAEFALTDATAIEVSAARSWGDAQYNTFNVGYGFKF